MREFLYEKDLFGIASPLKNDMLFLEKIELILYLNCMRDINRERLGLVWIEKNRKNINP